jgi:hypothetical protein
MKYYNVSTDETIDVSVAFYLWSRLNQLVRHDLFRWFVFGVAIPGKKICRECIENCAIKLHEARRRRSSAKYERERNLRA